LVCLPGCPFDFDPGEAPDVVAPPELTACERQTDPLEGSCLAELGAACFQPSGICTAVPIPPGAGLGWENGALLSFQPSATNAGVKEIIAYAPDGTPCFVALSAVDPGGQFVRTQYEQAPGIGYTLLEGNDGSLLITCPDGTEESLSVTDFQSFYQCLYGGDGGACDFAAVASLLANATPPVTSIGACSSAADCPTGTICCDAGSQAAYCSPVCL
jgi:hypothetical protein